MVFNGLGYADKVDAALDRETPQDGKAAMAADADKGVEAERVIPRNDLRRAIEQAAVGHREGEGIALVGGAEDGATKAQDVAGDDAQPEFLEFDRAAHQPHRALADADDAPAIMLDGAAD